jgi:bacillithiol system protein YtxJ
LSAITRKPPAGLAVSPIADKIFDVALTPLHAVADLEEALEHSHREPVVLFKHSHTCGVSAEALDELRDHIQTAAAPSPVRYAMVTVQTHRDLSNRIAERLGIRHETPQALLVRGGRVVWSASHFRVNAAELRRALVATS